MFQISSLLHSFSTTHQFWRIRGMFKSDGVVTEDIVLSNGGSSNGSERNTLHNVSNKGQTKYSPVHHLMSVDLVVGLDLATTLLLCIVIICCFGKK